MFEKTGVLRDGVGPLALKRKLDVARLRYGMLSARHHAHSDPLESPRADAALDASKDERVRRPPAAPAALPQHASARRFACGITGRAPSVPPQAQLLAEVKKKRAMLRAIEIKMASETRHRDCDFEFLDHLKLQMDSHQKARPTTRPSSPAPLRTPAPAPPILYTSPRNPRSAPAALVDAPTFPFAQECLMEGMMRSERKARERSSACAANAAASKETYRRWIELLDNAVRGLQLRSDAPPGLVARLQEADGDNAKQLAVRPAAGPSSPPPSMH
jgi:hypothetical protein